MEAAMTKKKTWGELKVGDVVGGSRVTRIDDEGGPWISVQVQNLRTGGWQAVDRLRDQIAVA